MVEAESGWNGELPEQNCREAVRGKELELLGLVTSLAENFTEKCGGTA
jgi:hypothetical protein